MRDSHRAVGVLLGVFAALAVGGQAVDVLWETFGAAGYLYGIGVLLAPAIVVMNGLQLGALAVVAVLLWGMWVVSFRGGRSGRWVAMVAAVSLSAAGLVAIGIPFVVVGSLLDPSVATRWTLALLALAGWEPFVMVPAFVTVALLGRDHPEPVDRSNACLWLASGLTIGASLLGSVAPVLLVVLVLADPEVKQPAPGLLNVAALVLVRMIPVFLGLAAAGFALFRGRAQTGRGIAAVALAGAAVGNTVAYTIALSWPTAAVSALALPVALFALWRSGADLRARSA